MHLTNVKVTNAPSTGFNLAGGTYHLESLTAQDTNDIGIAVVDATLLKYGTLSAVRTSKTASLKRAFDFERNANIQGVALWVTDDQTTATGYVAGFYGAQAGNVGVIYDQVTNGDLLVQNQSAVAYRVSS